MGVEVVINVGSTDPTGGTLKSLNVGTSVGLADGVEVRLLVGSFVGIDVGA